MKGVVIELPKPERTYQTDLYNINEHNSIEEPTIVIINDWIIVFIRSEIEIVIGEWRNVIDNVEIGVWNRRVVDYDELW